jgi:two-component system chemotaxis sensor kinase CheA
VTDDTGFGTYEIRFAPGHQLFLQGMNPVLLLRNLSELGTVLVTELDLDALPSLSELDPERCYLRWAVWLRTERSKAEIRDVFAFVEDSSQIEIHERSREWEEPAPKETAPGSPAAGDAGAPEPAAPARRAAAVTAHGNGKKASTLRVATEKVDKLVDLVGELVIAQSMVAQALNDSSKDALSRALEALAEMERNTRDLQERVMAVRMVPVGTVFNRFPRLVRDLSARCGKDVRLEMTGQEIEIDKGIVEEMADPLTHLLRNALDHGIEATDERRRAGKADAGTIRLAAYHQGGSVVVEVSDDGRGLNTARIREKGVALGLLRESDELSEEQIHALIFAPGFSTASAVSDISGRGVGMDVVRRNVDALNGSLTVTSRAGAGTCVRLKLPLTLAIMDGLSLRIGQQIFILPLSPIVESIRPSAQQLKSLLGRGEVVYVRDEAIPLVRLYELLDVEPEETDPRRALIVIVETGATKLGLLVDELLGQAQVVVKSLELNYRRVDAVMGATILGTGHVALILDVEGLARRMTSHRQPYRSKASPELPSTKQHKETAHVIAGLVD